MELIAGTSLSHRMQRELVAPNDVIDLVYDVAGVLAAAHERGVTHRDLKPDNIFLTPDLALKTTQKEDFFNLSGRRMTIMGTAFNGIREIWTHPFMALKDYEVGIRDIKGGIFWLNRLNPEVTITPEAVIREFRFETFAFKEVITVSPDKPIAVLHYESTRNLPIQLVFRLSSNMCYMWPYAMQDSRTAGNIFSPDLNAVVFSAQDNDLCTLVGFSEPVKDITQNPAGNVPFTVNPDDKVGMYEVTLDPQKGSVDLRIAAGSEGVDKVVDL